MYEIRSSECEMRVHEYNIFYWLHLVHHRTQPKKAHNSSFHSRTILVSELFIWCWHRRRRCYRLGQTGDNINCVKTETVSALALACNSFIISITYGWIGVVWPLLAPYIISHTFVFGQCERATRKEKRLKNNTELKKWLWVPDWVFFLSFRHCMYILFRPLAWLPRTTGYGLSYQKRWHTRPKVDTSSMLSIFAHCAAVFGLGGRRGLIYAARTQTDHVLNL